MAKAVTMTADGKKKLEERLQELKGKRRLEVAEEIKTAKSYGDLSENSEYDEAKNKQAMLEAEIADIEATLKNIVIVEEPKKGRKTAAIKFGSKVTVEDIELGEQVTYTIVSSIEASPADNKISDDCPLGVALLGKREGDVIDVEAPVGIIQYKIVKIAK